MNISAAQSRKRFVSFAGLMFLSLNLGLLSACDRLGNLSTVGTPTLENNPVMPSAQPTTGPSATPITEPTDGHSAAPVQAGVVHFSYSGNTGPERWAALAPEFEACGSGQRQSPINIKQALPPIQFDYKDATLKLINNGHTLQVNYPAGSQITVGEKRFELLQFHFHAPSENTLDGRRFPMELHLVHKDSNGKLGVVGVFIEEGSENPTLKTILNNLPKAENAEESFSGVTLNASAFLPQNHYYYGFDGSLTTPPCTEGVEWRVLRDSIQASKAQIDTFLALFPGGDSRPVQPLNGRVIQYSE